MKKINLLLLTAFVTSSLYATTHTEKTYLQTRPFLNNMPMEYSIWHTQVNKKKIGPWNATIQAIGFFQTSNNKSDLGDYFGYYAAVAQELRRYIPVGGDADTIPGRNLFHDQAGANNLAGQIQLNPKQKTAGFRLDFYKPIQNFFIKLSTPITYVENGLYPKAVGTLTAATIGAGRGQTIVDYFGGNVEETTANSSDLQKKLQYAKIGKSQNKTGLGDIELTGGYNIYKGNKHHLKAGICLTIPTSNRAKGEWLFEPITGNGGYWELGVFSDAKISLWKQGKKRIKFLTAGKLEYLFKETEKRTIGLKNYITPESESDSLAQYYLAGQAGQNALFPAANVLTQDVKIEPQLNFELLASTILISDKFTFELGYNLFYKEKEIIKPKNVWDDNKYALSVINYDSSIAAFNPLIGGDSLNNVGPINSANLNFEAAQSPSALTNKIYCAMGYSFNEWKRPLMLGIGGAYEFLSGNTALENLEIWLKSSLSF